MRNRQYVGSYPDQPKPRRKGRFLVKLTALLLLAIVAVGGYLVYAHYRKESAVSTTNKAAAAADKCQDAQGQLLIISISARHLWACNGSAQVYNSPVVTGMQNLPADLTPLGNYQIYAKQTNQTLTGSDSTGSWNDFVHYWEPFLINQYGVYGFHDATWRKDSEFGHVDPYSMNGSHGCIELPLNAAKWVHDWSVIGTSVSIVA